VGKGSQAPVFKSSHAHIIIYKPFRITRRTEKRQSGTLAPGVVASDSTTKDFTVHHAIAGFAAQQNQPTNKKTSARMALGGATFQVLRSWYSREHEKFLL
jgi:hypothetical protein